MSHSRDKDIDKSYELPYSLYLYYALSDISAFLLIVNSFYYHALINANVSLSLVFKMIQCNCIIPIFVVHYLNNNAVHSYTFRPRRLGQKV